MKAMNQFKWSLALALPLLIGCSGDGITALSNSDSEDSTQISSYALATTDTAKLISAFYGLDDAIPFLASYRICGSFGHQDGMPVIFSKEVDIATLQAGDFSVTLKDGSKVAPGCVTPAPAEDPGEFRTMLMIGDFGSMSNQPLSVEITGNLMSLDQQTNFKGAQVDVTPLEAGPTLVLAEVVPQSEWALDKEPSGLPFGGGSGCPASTRQVIRVVWAGGVTKPGGDEVDHIEREAYQVTVRESDETSMVTPFALGDLGDGDNNHELCLDTEAQVVQVDFPEGLMTDPREDLNPSTSITLL